MNNSTNYTDAMLASDIAHWSIIAEMIGICLCFIVAFCIKCNNESNDNTGLKYTYDPYEVARLNGFTDLKNPRSITYYNNKTYETFESKNKYNSSIKIV